jgi:4-hydroxy-2-oxoheptanedioate aldolase
MAGDGSRERLRARLRDGERLLGTFVKSRDPLISETLATAGYDFVVADLEHSSLSAGEVEGIVRACDAHDVPVITRIPATWLALCGALLDAGVTGIQVSDVSSAGVAAAVRAAAHYPPVGERSLSLSTRAALFGAVPAVEHVGSSLAGTVLIGQIESAAGLAALPEILESGVFDGLFFGPTDMAVALGHPGDPGHPDVAGALASATDLILGYGTRLGIFCATADEARQWSERGLTLLAISTDLGMLRGAAVSALGQLRAPG